MLGFYVLNFQLLVNASKNHIILIIFTRWKIHHFQEADGSRRHVHFRHPYVIDFLTVDSLILLGVILLLFIFS